MYSDIKYSEYSHKAETALGMEHRDRVPSPPSKIILYCTVIYLSTQISYIL